MSLAKNLKILRIQHNLTQQHMADMLFMSQAKYSNLERGKTTPTDDELCAIEHAFKIKKEALVSAIASIAFDSNQDTTKKEKEPVYIVPGKMLDLLHDFLVNYNNNQLY